MTHTTSDARKRAAERLAEPYTSKDTAKHGRPSRPALPALKGRTTDMSDDHRANQITVTCPNCHVDVTLTVEVSYLFSQPKSLSAQIGRCRGDHDCAALRPKRGRPRAKATTETAEADQ